MLGLGWTELMVIGVVGLIVIGPKDLPDMFRTLGRFTSKARRMAGEFQRAMESAADDTGVKDVAKDLKTMTSARSMGLEAVKGAVSKFEAWDPMRPQPKAMPVAGPADTTTDAIATQPKAVAVNMQAANGGGVAGTNPVFGAAGPTPAHAVEAAATKATDAVTQTTPAAKAPGRRRVAPTPATPVAAPLPESAEKKPRAPRKSAAKADAP